MTTTRKSGTRALLLGILALMVLSVPFGVRSAEPPDEDRQAAARAQYQKGKDAYDKGDFKEALVAFQEAYDTKPHPVVLKSIAECQASLGQVTAAIETYEKFLADPESKGKPGVEDRLKELKAKLATVEVTSEPEGAQITIDGEATGRTTPASFDLGPGDHEVTFQAEGYEPLVKNVTLEESAKSTLAVNFVEEGVLTDKLEDEIVDPFAGEETGEEEEVEEDSSGPPPVFWVTAALAGVGLVSGTVFGTMALNDEKDYKDSPTNAKKDAGEREAIIADVSFGVAAAAAVVGTIILLTYDRGEEAADDDSEAKLDVVPVAGKETIGLGAVITF